MENQKSTIVLGGGCFWCTEAIFKQLRGVISITSGYAGGTTKNPSYYDVAQGDSGHAEVIQVVFDESIIPLHDVLDIFWHTHDPTTLNRQGADVGTEYRSVILYTSQAQKEIAEKLKNKLNKNEFGDGIVTEIKPLDNFYEAEEHHKNYFERYKWAPYCQIVISPKLVKLRQKYAHKLKDKSKH